MKIIRKNAETLLFDALKVFWESAPASRCLYINCSKLGEELAEHINIAVNELTHSLDDNAQIYLCDDHDVFILARNLTQKHADEFLNTISQNIPNKIQDLLHSHIHTTLFEIGVDWPRLRRLCEVKIENCARQNKQKHVKKNDAISSVNREKALQTINKDLIETLAKRRAQRDVPEIMVVEDDVFSQKLVINALKNQYSLSMTADGQGALMTYVSKAPDVLFLDIGLPDIDGHVVLEKLFKIDPNAYVVMFSGNGDKDNILKAISLGAKGFVGKPFAKEKLIQYIEKSPFVQAKLNKDIIHEHHTH